MSGLRTPIGAGAPTRPPRSDPDRGAQAEKDER